MDGSEPLHTSLVESLHCPYPQLDVGVDGILHEDGNVNTLQGVGKCLHCKGVGCGAGANPKDVDAIFETQLHMLGRCHFSGHKHAGLFFHLFQPRERLLSVSFEPTGLGARLPHTGAEVVASLFAELPCCCHDLLFGLSTAWACYDEGALVVAGKFEGF